MMPKGFWRSGDGKLWNIRNMPTKYLKNCIQYVRDKMEELMAAIGEEGCEVAEEYLQLEFKLRELREEYFKRLTHKKPLSLDDVLNTMANDMGVIQNDNFHVKYRNKFKKGA